MADDLEKKMILVAAQVVRLEMDLRRTREDMNRVLEDDRKLLRVADKALTLVSRWIAHGTASAMMSPAETDAMLAELRIALKETFPGR